MAKPDKAQMKAEAIAAASGPQHALPVLVVRDGTILDGLTAESIIELYQAFGWQAALTVDVETTGYPVGHRDHRLKTIQLGNQLASVVLDAADPAQRDLAAAMLAGASTLHAHSAQADLVPLAAGGVIGDLDDAWSRVFDTVIAVKLTDASTLERLARSLTPTPEITEQALGLKALAVYLLDSPVSPRAASVRKDLFRANKWLLNPKPTTPAERNGWAQVDPACETMVRYAASDVLDTAAIAAKLYTGGIPAALLNRERAAQAAVARVSHEGVALDPDRVREAVREHSEARDAAASAIRSYGIENPGSPAQVGTVLAALGAQLPSTPSGKLSAAKEAVAALKDAEGDMGALARHLLDYRKSATLLGLILEPYLELITHGDGRARPTVYTLEAATGRMSCVRPNLQQVPRQGGIRACITADPGMMMISADFSSVEVRVAAALSGDSYLQQAITDGIDLHAEIAKQVYGPEYTKEDRYNSKRAVFGRLYGSGVAGIARNLQVRQAEAAAIVETLDALTPGLAQWGAGLRRTVQQGHTRYVTYSGRTIHLDADSAYKAVNYAIQGTARELLVDTLIRWQDTEWARCVLLPVHDELIVFVPEEDAERATKALVSAMETDLMGVAISAEASEPSTYWRDSS